MSIHSLSKLTLAAVLVFFSGCDLTGSVSEEALVRVTPDRATYQLADTTQIELQMENISSSPLFFSTCDRTWVEERDDGNAPQRAIIEKLCRCICTVEVEPGAQATVVVTGSEIRAQEDDLRLSGGLTYRVFPFLYADEKWYTDEVDPIRREAVQASSFRVEPSADSP